jgi:actin-like ATPase involved in cell morphogenesis
VAVTHPANWTRFQLDLLRQALDDVGLAQSELISEPAAAAGDYAATTLLDRGALVLVYDLGGGTFDVALLRLGEEGFEHQVQPMGIERLGGIDFDEAVFRFAMQTVPRDVLVAANKQPEGVAALANLRRHCVEAKESLSANVAADIPIMLPRHTATVRVTRHEFEAMISPMVAQTLDLVDRVLREARVDPASLSAALLVGGSSRVPLIPQRVAEHGLPVRIDAHPKLVVAMGAARRAAALQAHPRRQQHAQPPSDGGTPWRRRAPWLAGAAAAGVVVATIAVVATGDRQGAETAGSTTIPNATTASTVAATSTASTPPSTAAPTSAPTTTSTLPVVPAGFRREEFRPPGVQFVVPQSWGLIDPSTLDLSTSSWAGDLAAFTGISEQLLRETVGRGGVPYVFSDDRSDAFVPNISVESLPQFPAVDDVVAVLEPLPGLTVSDADRVGGNVDVVHATYHVERSPGTPPVEGKALAVGLSDRVVLIHVRTLDSALTESISDAILSTITPAA